MKTSWPDRRRSTATSSSRCFHPLRTAASGQIRTPNDSIVAELLIEAARAGRPRWTGTRPSRRSTISSDDGERAEARAGGPRRPRRSRAARRRRRRSGPSRPLAPGVRCRSVAMVLSVRLVVTSVIYTTAVGRQCPSGSTRAGAGRSANTFRSTPSPPAGAAAPSASSGASTSARWPSAHRPTRSSAARPVGGDLDDHDAAVRRRAPCAAPSPAAPSR